MMIQILIALSNNMLEAYTFDPNSKTESRVVFNKVRIIKYLDCHKAHVYFPSYPYFL